MRYLWGVEARANCSEETDRGPTAAKATGAQGGHFVVETLRVRADTGCRGRSSRSESEIRESARTGGRVCSEAHRPSRSLGKLLCSDDVGLLRQLTKAVEKEVIRPIVVSAWAGTEHCPVCSPLYDSLALPAEIVNLKALSLRLKVCL